jgi:lipopolysaccharide assembly protein A
VTLLLIFSILLAMIAAVFALQNAVPVTVAFLSWRFEGSLALVVLGSVLVGVLMTLFIFIPVVVKKNWVLSGLRRRLNESRHDSVEDDNEEIE